MYIFYFISHINYYYGRCQSHEKSLLPAVTILTGPKLCRNLPKLGRSQWARVNEKRQIMDGWEAQKETETDPFSAVDVNDHKK